jgi:pilus assembly protein Flp/PilA
MVRLYKYAKGQIAKIRKDESGATMIEYSVLIALITVALVTLITTVGGQLVTAWTTLTGAL